MQKIFQWYKGLPRWQRNVVFVFFLLLVYLAARSYTQRHLVSGQLPELNTLTLQGQKVNQALWNTQPVLLHFWASWCPVCKLEQDAINELAKDYTVITIAMNSGSEDAIEQYMQENQLSFPVVVDAEGELAKRFGVQGVPTGFVIDTEGRIRFREIGFTSGWGWRIRLWLANVF